MFGNSENKSPETDFKRHHVGNFAFNLNSRTVNQITVGQRFHDHMVK